MKLKLVEYWQKFVVWEKSHRALAIVIGAVFVLLMIFMIASLLSSENEEVSRTEPTAQTEAEKEPEPVLVPSPLTGVEVTEDLATRPVTAVVIENSPDARPQSSLHTAGVVFESIAEGGITRYLAFYQEAQPKMIGPVRSLRPYFSDWIMTFDASIAHVGGSATALAEVGPLGIKSLSQFSYGEYYVRTTDRFAPHNVYTDFGKLDALNERLGYTSSTFDSFPRRTPKPLATAKAGEITVNISSYLYQSSYSWDKASNTYLRRVAGKPEKDRETQKRIAPSVVVVMEAPFSIAADGRYDYELVGSGKVTVFQDGNAQVGTWKKSARDAQITFTSDAGNPIKLNPGMVWITAISPSQEVEYTP